MWKNPFRSICLAGNEIPPDFVLSLPAMTVKRCYHHIHSQTWHTCWWVIQKYQYKHWLMQIRTCSIRFYFVFLVNQLFFRSLWSYPDLSGIWSGSGPNYLTLKSSSVRSLYWLTTGRKFVYPNTGKFPVKLNTTWTSITTLQSTTVFLLCKVWFPYSR